MWRLSAALSLTRIAGRIVGRSQSRVAAACVRSITQPTKLLDKRCFSGAVAVNSDAVDSEPSVDATHNTTDAEDSLASTPQIIQPEPSAATDLRAVIRSYTPPKSSSWRIEYPSVRQVAGASGVVSAAEALFSGSDAEEVLETRDYANIIAACANYRPAAQPARSAFEAFCQLQKAGAVSMEVHANMMLIFCRMGDLQRTMEIADSMQQHDYRIPIDLLAELLMLLIADGKKPQNMAKLDELYENYKEIYLSQSIRLPARVYVGIAVLHCKLMAPDRVVAVLRDMTYACHDLNYRTLQPLLSVALYMGDHTVLRVLTGWYVQELDPSLAATQFSAGEINRILAVAGRSGDKQLAVNAFKVIEKSLRTPTPGNYYCLLRALLLSHDLTGAVDVLQDMERKGISFSNTDSTPAAFNFRQYASIRELFVASIRGSPGSPLRDGFWRADNLYYDLLERVRSSSTKSELDSGSHEIEGSIDSASDSDVHIPLIALDALVEVSGKMGNSNIAFATFQEYGTLFSVTPDINSYNALLRSCAYSPRVNTRALLAVFQEIEANIPETIGENENDKLRLPNCESYSILIESIVRAGDLQILEGVLEHMVRSDVLPHPRSLRRAAIALGKHGNWEKVDQVLSLLCPRLDDGAKDGGPHNLQSVPMFFVQRLNTIRQDQGLPQLAVDAASGDGAEMQNADDEARP